MECDCCIEVAWADQGSFRESVNNDRSQPASTLASVLGMADFYNSSSAAQLQRPPRILCLHGIRTSGAILRFQLQGLSKALKGKFVLVCPDAPNPAAGPPDAKVKQASVGAGA